MKIHNEMKRLIQSVFPVLMMVVFVVPTFADKGEKVALNSEEAREIQIFADVAAQAGVGILMTPPRGQISKAVYDTRKEVQKIFDEIAPEIKTEGISLVINIYASPDENAWVRQLNPASESSREYRWKKDHGHSIWPVRAAWGFS